MTSQSLPDIRRAAMMCLITNAKEIVAIGAETVELHKRMWFRLTCRPVCMEVSTPSHASSPQISSVVINTLHVSYFETPVTLTEAEIATQKCPL